MLGGGGGGVCDYFPCVGKGGVCLFLHARCPNDDCSRDVWSGTLSLLISCLLS